MLAAVYAPARVAAPGGCDPAAAAKPAGKTQSVLEKMK
jgi:hypothetical protein